ncbi:folylpolyglutamate synthase [Gaertneriomyces sp. JEL0708]|nr:folylpolyglutamate synthase [Gaertneriomyces sp. JEL0708]
MSVNLGLSRISKLLSLLGNPENVYPTIHIAGTNGKGSISTIISSVLTAGGYKTGRFNSPHLIHPHDTTRISEQVVAKEDYDNAREKVTKLVEEHAVQASPFEVQTAVALWLFAEHEVDVAIVECGLGGRLDATNIIPAPLVCVFASVGLDHMEFLGNNILDIAREKAGIIKPGAQVVVAPQVENGVVDVIRERARDVGCNIHLISAPTRDSSQHGSNPVTLWYKQSPIHVDHFPLLGSFQHDNAHTAFKALSLLPETFHIPIAQISQALKDMRWPGRLERVVLPDASLPMYVDGAHNVPAARALANFVHNLRDTLQDHRVAYIVAFTQTKPVMDILQPLIKPNDVVNVVPFSAPEDMPWIKCSEPVHVANQIEATFDGDVLCRCWQSLRECIDSLVADRDRPSLIVLCGSLYLVADLYREYSLPC